MLLRNSISGTKKFIQKTFGGLKSLFSKGNYEKLPKASPLNNTLSYADVDSNHVHHLNYKDLDKLYTELAQDYWDNSRVGVATNHHQSKKRTTNSTTSTPTKQGNHREFQSGKSKNSPSPVKAIKNSIETQSREALYPSYNNRVMKRNVREEERENVGRSWLVEEKLKELEMLDMSNVDHVLDIEEVLHYYSRLTCPAYLEIVDRFFFDIYAEFFKPPSTPASKIVHNSSSTLRRRRPLNH